MKPHIHLSGKMIMVDRTEICGVIEVQVTVVKGELLRVLSEAHGWVAVVPPPGDR